ncbi:MAG: NAD(P)-dependent alcohol dehydrogenase [Lawsonibacter sp.]|nr:NAD(P)-dependent alcohol dehydrogenase [Lawsonibacter sp.]
MENREALLVEQGKLEVFPCAMPEVQEDEVLVKMEYCGVCGSDVHYFRFGGIGRRKVTYPYVLGHECTGEVMQIGPKVTNVAVGDKVVLEPGLGCGRCEYCMTGRYNLCEDMKFMATPPYPGAFKRYLAYPARGCFKLPDRVSTLEGAMIEPLAVGMHAARRGEVDNSKVVLITGMGCIGLMTLLACKAMNAQRIIVTDVFQNRLDKALSLGADEAINVAETDMIERLKELTGGKGADIVFETAGRAQTAAQNVFAVRRGGVIVQVGTIADPVPYQFNELGKIEADIRSVFRYRNIFPLAIQLIEKGDIDLKAIGPDIFAFEDVAQAFDTAIHRGNEVVKCILKF